MSNPLDKKIRDFRKELKQAQDIEILRKYIILGERHHLTHEQYVELRQRVSKKWGVHPNQIQLVGSAQLGFSISEKIQKNEDGTTTTLKRYRKFRPESDIDIAIISRQLFDHVWQRVYAYSLSTPTWFQKPEFQDYLFRGWIRPDKMPKMAKDCFKTDWFEFFNELTRTKDFGDHKINGAVYADWHFLESYQLQAINGCMANEHRSAERDEDDSD